MDSVRFGRVLGVGARLAGKTLAEAVDAATSPDPAATSQGNLRPILGQPARKPGADVVRQVKATSHGVRRGGSRFGDAVWGPVARASGRLWLEVTGVFFGLITVMGLDGMWINRGAVHWTASGRVVREHFLLGLAVALVFGYFAVSSFVRAARGGRSSN